MNARRADRNRHLLAAVKQQRLCQTGPAELIWLKASYSRPGHPTDRIGLLPPSRKIDTERQRESLCRADRTCWIGKIGLRSHRAIAAREVTGIAQR